ncbi:hypothetical protein [Parvularcula sp. LCG005]|uniref:hypothetical protein n=1 Tax=Parvularcula sp. LCG005 TaxID=3078805 RepID=UPI0029424556|nr:hypothetical protein [Parvularcula sp. LCG005]WOI53667.1 hypothetical protein RUI03_01410 [Parvularcula sp. LCG005]
MGLSLLDTAKDVLSALLPVSWTSERAPVACNLARSIILVGQDQNDDGCVRQRRALKPILHEIRRVHINVVEIYGNDVPRRNGQPMSWLNTRKLRRSLDVKSGFHFLCVDDQGEIGVRGRVPVSQAVLAELVMGEERMALPPPKPERPKTRRPGDDRAEDVEAERSPWSVGVLR